jgi:hypothetical protein
MLSGRSHQQFRIHHLRNCCCINLFITFSGLFVYLPIMQLLISTFDVVYINSYLLNFIRYLLYSCVLVIRMIEDKTILLPTRTSDL